MDIIIGIKTTTSSGQPLKMDCPNCGMASAPARALEYTEKASLFHVIPLFTLRNTLVVCDSCKWQSLADRKGSELTNMSPAQVAEHTSRPSSLLTKVLVVLSLLLFWVPLIGLILSILSLRRGFKHRGWIRTTAVVATFASVAVTGLVIFVLIADSLA